MKHKLLISTILIFLGFKICHAQSKEKKSENEKNYIFFLHNKFLEENSSGSMAAQYGTKAEYNEILTSFRKDNFIVISEKRKPKTNPIEYAKKVITQIDSLIKLGAKPNHITIIGTSKGGYIAQYVSSLAKNEHLNFVFIGCFQESDILKIPDINFCGNILTIYEKSDVFGVSAIARKKTSSLKINQFKEIRLNTGLRHGFLYLALEEWLKPSKTWARGNYKLIK